MNQIELFDILLKHDIFIILLRSIELLILRVNVSVPGFYINLKALKFNLLLLLGFKLVL